MKKLLSLFLLLIGCTPIDEGNLNLPSMIKQITNVSITKLPEISFNAGEDLVVVDYGQITISYNDQSWDIVEINQEQVVNIDLFDNQFQIQYQDYSLNAQLNIKSTRVNNSQQLQEALSNQDTLILIAEGEYDLVASSKNTYITEQKILIGQNNPIINISGEVASQAGIIFKNTEVTLKNLTINSDAKASLKLIASEKSFLSDVELIGGGGLDVYDTNCTIQNSVVKISEDKSSATVKISNSLVRIKNCIISYGNWGSIGIMYHPDDVGDSVLMIEDCQIDYVIYIENYPIYQDRVSVQGLSEEWLFALLSETGIYYLPKHLGQY